MEVFYNSSNHLHSLPVAHLSLYRLQLLVLRLQYQAPSHHPIYYLFSVLQYIAILTSESTTLSINWQHYHLIHHLQALYGSGTSVPTGNHYTTPTLSLQTYRLIWLSATVT